MSDNMLEIGGIYLFKSSIKGGYFNVWHPEHTIVLATLEYEDIFIVIDKFIFTNGYIILLRDFIGVLNLGEHFTAKSSSFVRL